MIPIFTLAFKKNANMSLRLGPVSQRAEACTEVYQLQQHLEP